MKWNKFIQNYNDLTSLVFYHCKKILVTGIDKDYHFNDDDFLSIHIYLNMLLGGVLK